MKLKKLYKTPETAETELAKALGIVSICAFLRSPFVLSFLSGTSLSALYILHIV